MNVTSDQTGMEIGSGCGYLTLAAAQRSKRVYALDISASFLNQAKEHCTSQNNIEFLRITPGVLDPVLDSSMDYVFSNNVFIHLNFYEIFS